MRDATPRRRRRRSPIAGLLVVAALGAGGYVAYQRLGTGGPGVDVPITRDVLQAQVASQFPVKQGKAEFSEPEVILKPGGDRIGMKMKVRVPMLGASGDIEADGRLRYDADSGAFLLDDPRLRELHVRNLPGALTKAVKGAVNPALKALHSIKVYELDDSLQSQAARRALRGVRVEDGRVVVTLGMR